MATTFEDVIVRVTQRGADETAKAIGLIGKESEKTTGALAALNRIAYTIGAAFSAKSLLDTVDAYQSMSNQLKLVTKNATDLATAQERLFKMAQTNRTAIADVTDLYTKLALSQKEIGISGERIYGVVDTITKALANNGKGSQAAAAGLKQLIQGLQSGKLAGEELKSVLENTPYLANMLAKGLNVPLGKLREMGAAGELTAQRVVQAFEKMSGAINKDFGKMNVTISQALTVLDNAWKKFIGSTSEATGASSLISSTIVLLANNLSTVVTVLAAATAAWIAYRIAVVAVTAATVLANVAMNANPIVRLVTIITAAIALLITLAGGWDKVGAAVMSFGKSALEIMKSIYDGTNAGIKYVENWGNAWVSLGQTISTNFTAAIQGIWDFIKGWYDWLSDLIGKQVPDIFKNAVDSVYNFFKDGFTKIKDFVVGIFNAIRDALNSFAAWAQGIINSVVSAAQKALAVVKSIGGGSSTSQVDGQRAAGGPVSGGKTYLVGENGPELFSPGTNGMIIPNGGSGTPFQASGAPAAGSTGARALQNILAEAIGNHLVALQDIGNEHSKKLDSITDILTKISTSTSQTNSTVQAAASQSSNAAGGTSALNNYVQNGMTFGGTPSTTQPIAPAAGGSGGGSGSSGGSGNQTNWGMLKSYAAELARLIDRYQRNLWSDPTFKFSRTQQSYAAYRNYLATIPSEMLEEVKVLAGSMLPATMNGFVMRTGGSFTVPGHTGVDSKVVPIRASPGEEISVRTRKQQIDRDEGKRENTGGQTIIVQLQATDADSFRRSETQLLRNFAGKLGNALRKN